MKTKRWFLWLASVMILSLVMTACSPTATEAPQAEEQPVSDVVEEEPTEVEEPAAEEAQESDETSAATEKSILVFAMTGEPDTLLSGYGITADAAYAFELLFNKLTTKDTQGNNVGDLAESWELSEDQMTWTFHLVQNATWHDGEPFTAEDVAFTFETLADPGYTGMDYTMIESVAGVKDKHDGLAESISGIQVVDDYTIAITTNEPNALILETMAGMMTMLPKHALEGIPVADLPNTDFARMPIGTGPYMLREWNTEESLIFDKNPNYFKGPAEIDTFIWQVILEPSAQITALLNGEVDFISVAADDFPQVQNVDGITAKTTPGSGYFNINFHHTDPLLADVRTRQALAHAMDREGFLQGVFAGLGTIESCIFHPSLPEYDASISGYSYDPELAKSMLTEVGWKDEDGDGILEAHGVEGVEDGTPFAIEVVTRANTQSVRFNEMIQQYLKIVGVDATFNSVETSVYFSDYFIMGGPWQVSGSRWINLIGSPQQELLWNITCDSNSMFDYCDPELDAKIASNSTIFDDAERAENFHEIWQIMNEQAIYLPMVRWLDLYAYDSNLVVSDYQTVIDIYRTLPDWHWK